MFFQNAHLGKNQFWRYLLTIVIFFAVFASIQVVFLMPLFIKQQELMVDAASFAAMFDVLDFEPLHISKLYTLIMIVAPFALSLGVLMLLIKFIHKKPLLKLFTARENFDWKRVFFGFIVTFILTGGFLYLFVPHHFFTNQFDVGLFIPLFIATIILIPLQATLEEVFVRGYLFQAIGLLIKNKFITMLLIIGIFTTAHLANPEFNDNFARALFEYILISVTLGVIAVLDDGLEISIGVHTAINIFLIIVISTTGSSFNTDALFRISFDDMLLHTSLLQSFAMTLIMLALFGYVYKWKLSTLFLT